MSLEPDVLAAIRAGMSKVRCPGGNDRVYKDECMYTFDNPFSPTGLFVNLNTWHGVAHDFVEFDSQRSSNNLYVHLKYTKVPKEAEPESKEEPTKLAIGVDGGFQLDSQKFDIVKDYGLMVLKGGERVVVPFPNTAVPEFVGRAVQAVIDHQGASLQAQAQAWVDDEKRPVSKYAVALEQVDNGVRISNNPSSWKCADSGATDNLWLNLSTGYIGSGRPQYLLSGVTGGTGAALKHYEETGRKYPLVVKLGTITPNGADVYSYAPDEDCMVEDPKLAEHLKHWGIDIMSLEKTQKTMAEMEVETNKSWEFSRITEAGTKLVPMRGPGYVGLVNLGNSCYMNSTLQLLFTLPELKAQYLDKYRDLVMGRAVSDPAGDHLTQMAKLAMGLLSDRYAPPATEEEAHQAGEQKDLDFTTAVEPRMFKTLFGKGHPEFSSGRQQDASEYLQHLMSLLQRCERVGFDGRYYTDSLFRFKVEDRYQCLESKAVKYLERSEGSLEVTIPLEAAVNRAAVAEYQERKLKRQKLEESVVAAGGAAEGGKKDEEEEVHPVVPWSACFENFLAAETLEDWFSSALGRKGLAGKTQRFKTFPKYLLVQLKRYFVDETWTPRKLEATVDMPDELDLTPFRSDGRQPGEVALPEDGEGGPASAAPAPAPLQPDPAAVATIESMGFSANAAARALLAVQNASAEHAMQWIFDHMDDADLNDPLPAPSTAAAPAPASTATAAEPDPEVVANLAAMLGFADNHVKAALKATNNDSERAADWLFSHADDLDSAVAAVEGASSGGSGGVAGAAVTEDRADMGKYQLVGFISHIGRNTGSGHYVAHIRKGGRWVIYDDQKVALSEHPPRGLGYLYLYARVDPDSMVM